MDLVMESMESLRGGWLGTERGKEDEDTMPPVLRMSLFLPCDDTAHQVQCYHYLDGCPMRCESLL